MSAATLVLNTNTASSEVSHDFRQGPAALLFYPISCQPVTAVSGLVGS
ncbi:hypothetical protein PH5382_01744 [Phaeobacter sp. CECT 5382]|nr:hypothetical protein [Phaeobacter sp. CECT 5382]CUH87815.1 hypothetical protein PH5382_01744 [Phaeobacter sp. CECT 5382]